MPHKKWFENWFDSPYYHILYQNRNDDEAKFFIDNLCAYLKPSLNDTLLDVACGRGRHAIYLNKKGSRSRSRSKSREREKTIIMWKNGRVLTKS